MKLYSDAAKRAPSPRRSRIAFAEKGIPVEIVTLDMASAEHQAPEFLAISPRGLLPVLVLDDGTVITEGVAIASYLDSLQPEPSLMGRWPVEKARALEWLMITETEGFAAVAEAWRNSHPAFAGRALNSVCGFEQIPALVERGLKRIPLFFDLLERRLADSLYLAGDQFTYADISAGAMVDFARAAKQAPGDHQVHLKRWHAAVSARPSWSA